MNKFSKWTMMLGVSALMSTSITLADECMDRNDAGLTVTEYGVTVLDVSLCEDVNCNSSTSVVTGTISNLNLAGAAGVKGTMSPAEIPFGSYGWIRVIISPTINVAGYAAVGQNAGAECITQAGSGTGAYYPGAGWVEVDPSGGRNPGTVALTIPNPTPGLTFNGSGNVEFIEAVGPIVVEEGATFPAIDLKFTAKDAIGIGGIDGGPGRSCAVGIGTPHIELTINGGAPAVISDSATTKACAAMETPIGASWE
jgi:hypothetical protein